MGHKASSSAMWFPSKHKSTHSQIVVHPIHSDLEDGSSIYIRNIRYTAQHPYGVNTQELN
jgi:hypothetical protein